MVLETKPDCEGAGREMLSLMKQLYPICRSISGNGVRETLAVLSKHIPLEVREVPSGTKVFDWTVPKEWNATEAYIKCPDGKRIADFRKNNLHLLSYSVPVRRKMKLAELREHLFTIPQNPDWVPYLTSYYKETWGFCMTHNQLKQLKDGIYAVRIDSSLKDGSLTYGELLVKGSTSDEVLLSTYVCHPSMCNDNLSGVVLLVALAKLLLRQKPRYSYRFLFIPETIGAIAWLSRNEKRLDRIKHGLVATCLGDRGNMTYKKSRGGNYAIDRAVQKALTDSGSPFRTLDFFPSGSDERQFCSPAFNLPVGSLMRTPYAEFPEYHTSADNLELMSAGHMEDSLKRYLDVIFILENDGTYINLNPKCEPQLGKRGLYSAIGGQREAKEIQKASLWVLNLSDGRNSLLDISMRSGMKFQHIRAAADALLKGGLLRQSD